MDRQHRRPGTRARCVRQTAASLLTMVVVLWVPTSLPAQAAPPLTVADAKARIEQLEIDAAAVDQQYAGVQDQLKQLETQRTLRTADTKAQRAKVDRLRLQAGQVALAKYQNRELDTAAQLFFSEDTDDFLSQISTVGKVSDNQNVLLQDYQQQLAQLQDLQRTTQLDQAQLEVKKTELTALRQASDQKIKESQSVLNRLKTEQRAELAAQDRRRAAEDRATAEAGDKSASPTTDPNTAGTAGRGAKAMAFARKQLGKPYRFGATGPDAYDCSGLTGAAWRAAGVNLSRTSQQQFRNGRPVSKSELRPGDLVFFYNDLSHEGLYAGNGMLLHSPRPGKQVEYIKMSYMPFAGARRPG